MSISNQKLYEALKLYVEKSVDLLADLCKHAQPVNFESLEWSETQVGLFSLKQRQQLSWKPCIVEHLEVLHAASEYADLVVTLQNDPVVGPQVDTLVGTPYSRTRLDLHMLTDSFIGAVVDKAGEFRFDEGSLRDAYEFAEAALYKQTVDVLTVAPLPNLGSAAHAIKLDVSASIEAMTDWEVTRAISAGFFPHHPAVFEIVEVPSRCAVRHRQTVPKVWGDAPSPPAQGYHSSAHEAVTRAISAIRIIKGADVFSPGYFTYSDHWLMRGGISSTLPTRAMPFRPSIYGLSQPEVNDLSSVSSELGSENVTRHGPLNNAIRRYEYAGERQRPEDRIIDLMIAAESLFLHDSRGDRGELRYRLAVRAAFFLGSSPPSRRQVFDLMTHAYQIRSKVAHGDPPTTVRLGEKTLSLHDFTLQVEGTIRLALRKMIHTAVDSKGEKSLVDWEALILSGDHPSWGCKHSKSAGRDFFEREPRL